MDIHALDESAVGTGCCGAHVRDPLIDDFSLVKVEIVIGRPLVSESKTNRRGILTAMVVNSNDKYMKEEKKQKIHEGIEKINDIWQLIGVSE